MKIQLLDKVACDGVRSMSAVDPIENVKCGLHGECRDSWALALSGDYREAGGDEEAYCVEPAQFLHQETDLLEVWSLGIKNRLSTIKDYEHLHRGEE